MAEPTRPNRVGVTELTGHRWQLTVEDGQAGVRCAEACCERCEHGDAELVEGLPLGADPIPVSLRVEVDDESSDWGEGAVSAWLVAVPQAAARVAELDAAFGRAATLAEADRPDAEERAWRHIAAAHRTTSQPPATGGEQDG